MMLEDGVFHADPHAGNLLVDPQGRLVLLDFGMVLQVERETRRRLVQTVLAAAARQDVDGVINGFYELGILDPDVDRGTVRDAAQSLMAISLRDDVSPRQIQQLVEQVLRTFYEWPLMLPSNLVYFGRAGVLVEGIGLRYNPNFNALAVARPVLARSAARLIQGAAEDPRARITDWTQEAMAAVRTLGTCPPGGAGRARCPVAPARRARAPAIPGPAGAPGAAGALRLYHRADLQRGVFGDAAAGGAGAGGAARVRHVLRGVPAADAPVPEPAPLPPQVAGALGRELRELAGLFFTLGSVGFGGPAAHIAMMEEHVVRRRGWMTREEFLELVGVVNLLPGPNSTELAIHIGHRRAGVPGLLVAGVAFILPATLLVLACAWAYVRYGAVPVVQGIWRGVQPVVVAVVATALVDFARTGLRSFRPRAAAAAALLLAVVGVNEFLILLVAGALALGTARRGAAASVLCAAPSRPRDRGGVPRDLPVLLRVGSVLYGSGYVLWPSPRRAGAGR
jgi:chromate transport protein ChrA